MIILTLRTDKPEAELGLFDGPTGLAYDTWEAHRQLSVTIHTHIRQLLVDHGKQLADVAGLVCFEGPGSFTGLRMGLSVANALAYGLQIPIVATQGDDWIQQGITRLTAGQDDHIALPHYGAPAHITQQKR